MQASQLKILQRRDLAESVCVVLGTRPAIIKMSPVVRALKSARIPFFLLHTGQHYSHDMDGQFFDDLHLARPKYRISGVESSLYHGDQTARMLTGAEQVLIQEKPRITIVGGDANTNLAGGLAARKLGIMLGHVEAGLRSNDWRMPEEHNRVMLDHISDLLFAPSEFSRRNLIRDNVKGRIFVVGNTIADSVTQNVHFARTRKALNKLGLSSRQYLLMTAHREENVDNRANLKRITRLIRELSRVADLPIVFPMHPRTRKRFKQFQIKIPQNLLVTHPLGYLDFLQLLSNSRVVVTDSGGIQEEASILGVPCITIRRTTERPETTIGGANIVVGLEEGPFVRACFRQLKSERNWKAPFKPGASRRIALVLKSRLSN